MTGLLSLSRLIDGISTRIGRWLSWLILVAVVVSAVNAIIRKVFDQSSNAWLELQWVLFGAVFLLCSAWTLSSNEHIRIDVVNGLFSKRVRNWIDMFGHFIFLMPFTLIMIYMSWPFALRSYAINEQSVNAGGLPQWPAKFLVLLGFVLLAIQGISEIIKRAAIMTGHLEETSSGGGHHAAAEAEAERLLAHAKAEQSGS